MTKNVIFLIIYILLFLANLLNAIIAEGTIMRFSCSILAGICICCAALCLVALIN
jgi:hypothetical protein